MNSFNTVNGRCCCNLYDLETGEETIEGFNTVNGRCCCNTFKLFY